MELRTMPQPVSCLDSASGSSPILFGAAYYPEYRTERPPERDLDLMVAAGFTVIRVGESVWSTWEPRDGEFDLEWLRPILDAAHERKIAVILGTPTYAIPPWLQVAHPELAAETATGKRIPWGARQEIDYTSPVFRTYAERIIRKVVETYCEHPAVIGYQVDNEPGMVLFHNDHVFAGFVERLKRTHGTVEALNEAWGLTYWSHRLTSFDELWRPDGNSFPQYDLEWRRYQAQLTDDFIHWQAGIVREYASPSQFVTTCIAYPRPAIDDVSLTAALDVVAGNAYYDMQDGFDLVADRAASIGFAVSGVGAFFRQADRMWSGRHERFLVTETDAQSIGGHSYNLPPYPGQLKQAAYGLVSRGARMIEYWHWQTLNNGFETYWGGVLPHSGTPGRIYDEVSELGGSLSAVGPALDGYVPDADIAILYSNASRWAFEFFGPLPSPSGRGDPASYARIFDAFHTGIVESDRQAVIIHDSQLAALDAATYAADHPVLVVPALYVAGDAVLQWLRGYAQSGGHLVLGIRSAYADEEARVRKAVAPPLFADLAGVHYDEYSNLPGELPVTGADGFMVSPGAAATEWADGLIVDDAIVVAEYQHRELGRFPAITTRTTGDGRVTYVGTVPNPTLARDIARWLVPTPVSTSWAGEPQGRSLTVSGTTSQGRVRFVFNWSGEHVDVTVPIAVTDLETAEAIDTGSIIPLSPWGTRVLQETPSRS
jgi:beta-galactosidase